MTSKELTQKVVEILQAHKGEDIVTINLEGKTEVSDYFVLASGRSSTHTRSLINHVDEELEKIGTSPIRTEGLREGRWAVLDYGDVIVHIFNDEARLFYHLEKLWGDENNVTKY